MNLQREGILRGVEVCAAFSFFSSKRLGWNVQWFPGRDNSGGGMRVDTGVGSWNMDRLDSSAHARFGMDKWSDWPV